MGDVEKKYVYLGYDPVYIYVEYNPGCVLSEEDNVDDEEDP